MRARLNMLSIFICLFNKITITNKYWLLTNSNKPTDEYLKMYNKRKDHNDNNKNKIIKNHILLIAPYKYELKRKKSVIQSGLVIKNSKVNR